MSVARFEDIGIGSCSTIGDIVASSTVEEVVAVVLELALRPTG